MRSRSPTLALFAAFALSCAGALIAPAAGAAGPALSPSAYAVSRLCARPSPGHAGCLGLRLVAKAPLSVPHARALGAPARGGKGSSAAEFTEPIPGSFTPGELLGAYNLPAPPAGSGQTIAIVDAYDDATIESDLEHYDQRFALSACSEKNGCFRKVNQDGKSAPLPASESTWALEIATDVELAHGICQGCRILLVEARSSEYGDLSTAEATAARLGANEVSNSWGGEEPLTDGPAFDQPGVVVTAASGDSGYRGWLEEPAVPADYPASSPHVVAVGGTRLALAHPGNGWAGETVWNDGGRSGGLIEGAGATGGGCSAVFQAPAWQQAATGWSSVGCASKRAVADVSADADPYTGVAEYDSTAIEGNKGWGVIGGTSVASPIVAAVFALAGGAHGVQYPAQTLYENALGAPGSLHDILSGSNGECPRPFNYSTGTAGCSSAQEGESCASAAICLAGAGYDGPSGVGTPSGIAAFQPPAPTGPSTTPGSPGSGGSGGVTTPAQAGGKGQAAAGVSGASPGAGTPGASGSPPARRAARGPVIWGLRLTGRAVAALRRAHPHVSQVGFAFALSTGARLRVTLARRVLAGGRLRWKQTAWASLLLATGGQEARHLHGRRALVAGRYRLTLLPAGGRAVTINFRIG